MDKPLELLQLSGTVEGVIYSNDETGYAICDLAVCDDGGKEQDIVTIVGIMPYIAEGDSVSVYGSWVHNVKYGRQFKVEQWEKSMPTDSSAILRYLSSRAIKGIGPRTAQKIVAEFGDETFDVIENHPEWLASISGISRKKALEISEDFKSKLGMHASMMFFRDYFGPALSVKIYNKWGSRAIEIAKKNPYRLAEEIEHIGFDKADAMAQKLGIERDSPDRIEAGILHTLQNEIMSNGHACIPRQKLAEASVSILGVNSEAVEDGIRELLKRQRLKYVVFEGEQYMYTAYSYECERYVAEKLVELDKMCISLDVRDVNAFIERSERERGIEYASLQRKAISDALGSGVVVLTGGPGTGKTTVVRALIDIFDSLGMKVALCAPTGRAAKRLSEATSREAKTIHRLLEMSYGADGDSIEHFRRNENDLLGEDAIVVDEASMVDQFLMCALLKAIKPGARIVLIGDSDQLPSVGAGNVLGDIIASGRFSTVKLKEIFRQAQKSLIITNAHAINGGKMPDLNVKDNDFFFMPRASEREISATIAQLCASRLPRAYGEMGRNGVQIISPSRKGEAGTENLNVILQNALNAQDGIKKEYKYKDTLFREGDKVMQKRNNYELAWDRGAISGSGIFNGDIGVIERIDTHEQRMEIRFDERLTLYDFSLLDDIEHAYAITVHKSQGSEYPIVIIPLYYAPIMLLSRNLFYTAVTRAEKMVILIGDERVVRTMVDNDRHTMRYTGLARMLAAGEDENE